MSKNLEMMVNEGIKGGVFDRNMRAALNRCLDLRLQTLKPRYTPVWKPHKDLMKKLRRAEGLSTEDRSYVNKFLCFLEDINDSLSLGVQPGGAIAPAPWLQTVVNQGIRQGIKGKKIHRSTLNALNRALGLGLIRDQRLGSAGEDSEAHGGHFGVFRVPRGHKAEG